MNAKVEDLTTHIVEGERCHQHGQTPSLSQVTSCERIRKKRIPQTLIQRFPHPEHHQQHQTFVVRFRTRLCLKIISIFFQFLLELQLDSPCLLLRQISPQGQLGNLGEQFHETGQFRQPTLCPLGKNRFPQAE